MEIKRSSGKLEWVEVGRGLAALGVVLTHYSVTRTGEVTIPFFRSLGGYSVEFFFVLSGFIIFYAHGKEAGEPKAVIPYIWRRFVRVFPTYWMILGLALLATNFQPTLRNVDFGPLRMLRESVLAPGNTLMIGQAWTLRHEVLFYAIFSLMLLNKRVGIVAFLAWMGAVAGNLAINGLPPGQVNDPLGILVHHYNLDFLLGMVIAIALRREKTGLALAISLAVMLPPLVIWIASGYQDATAKILFYKPLFAAVLIGAITASRRGVPAPQILVKLGAASYALYISHELTGSVSDAVLRHIPLGQIPVLTLRVAAAVTFAWGFHELIEAPVIERLRHLPATWVRRRRERLAEAAA
jgi:peptidoglycan/LPS O-acetylase OafA/YrhL